MRMGLIAVLLVLAVASPASAQETEQQQADQLRSARLKVWTGTAFVLGGALIMSSSAGPAAVRSGLQASDATFGAGSGVVAVGTALVWSGFRQRRRAAVPHTEFGFSVGQRKGVIIRRRW